MAVNKKRLLIVLSVLVVLGLGAGGVYTLRFQNSQKASALEVSARRYLDQGNFDAAKIELDKLLLLQPKNANAHFLRGQALLAGKDSSRIQTTDRPGLDAMRSFIQASKLNPDFTQAQQILVAFFIGAGDLAEASNYARPLLRSLPENADAHFALGATLIDHKQTDEAASHIEFLLTQEKPVRPRSIWLAAQLGELLGKASNLTDRAGKLVDGLRPGRRGRVSKTAWLWSNLRSGRRAARPTADAARTRVDTALGALGQLAKEKDLGGAPPRSVLLAAFRVQALAARPGKFNAVFASFGAAADTLINQVYQRAIENQSFDPNVYVEYATRLRQQGKADDAIKVIQGGLEAARAASPEVRNLFAACDLWLAEHYLTERQPDKAQTYIDNLTKNPATVGWGQLLSGYRLLQLGDWEAASKMLTQALTKLPDHGITNALFGLCQLKRGFISEGRQFLEKGIRLGADEPKYKAWLAVALADAGYQEQAMTLARQVLADRQTQGLGRALLGQLRLRAGQFESAEADLAEAVKAADPAVQPSLQLLQAELQMTRGQAAAAQQTLAALKQVPTVAARAFAMEYRFYKSKRKDADADRTLAEARSKYPDDVALLSLETARLVEQKQHDAAIQLLEQQRQKQPKLVGPILLLAEVYDLKNDANRALNVLRTAAQTMPEEVALRIRLAEKLITQHSFAEAGKLLADLKGNPAVNPSTLDSLLARAASMNGDDEKAAKIVENGLHRDPDNAVLKFLRGQMEARKGNYSTASELFEQTLASGAYQQQSVQALFESLLRAGQTDKAMSVLSQAERRGQPVDELRGRLLRLLARQEQWDTVDRELATMLKNGRTESDIALAVSLYRYMNQLDKAEKLLADALAQRPKSSILNEHKVSLLIEKKDFATAEQLLSRLLVDHSANPTFHVLKVHALLETNRVAEADEAARAGWKQCPGNPALAALRVQTAIKRNQPNEGFAFAVQAQKEHPKLPAPKYMMARVYEALNQRSLALPLMADAVAEDPADINAAHHYLRMRIAEGQTSDLKETVEKLLTANPQNPLLLGVLVEYYAGQGELPKAEATLATLDQSGGSGPLFDYSRAVVAVAKRKYPEAERFLRVALADPRGHLPSHFLLARVLAGQNRVAEALEIVNQALRQQPTANIAQWMRADFLTRLGRLDEAEIACRQALKDDPKGRPFRLLLTQVLSKRGAPHQAEAVRLAQELLREGTDNPTDFESLAKVLLYAGKNAEVLTLARNQAAQERFDLMLAGGRALLAAGDFRNAEELARTVVAKNSNLSAARLLRADALARLAKENNSTKVFEQAADEYRAVLQQSPNNLIAANNLAWTVGVHLEKPHRAIEELMQALPGLKNPSPDLPVDLLDTVGTLHLLMEHFTEAQEFLQAAVVRSPDNPAVLYHLGDLYRRQNQPDRAARNFEQVVKLAPQSEWAHRIQQERKAN